MPELDLLILEMPVRTLLSTVPEKGYKKFYIQSGKLPWSHNNELLSIPDDPARSSHENQCGEEGWSVRELKAAGGRRDGIRELLADIGRHPEEGIGKP